MNADDEESFTASVVFIKLPDPEIDVVVGGGEQKDGGVRHRAVNPPERTANRQGSNKGGHGSSGQVRSP